MGGHPGGMGGGGGFYEMVVPGFKVGLIIGKGGETIKQLQVGRFDYVTPVHMQIALKSDRFLQQKYF
jgi:hypothetical protein